MPGGGCEREHKAHTPVVQALNNSIALNACDRRVWYKQVEAWLSNSGPLPSSE
jgi:hypothetical protein